MQLEFPDAAEVPQRLDVLRARYPDADLYVLSEYTFQEPVPAPVKDWCLKHQKYLLVGGKEPASVEDPDPRGIFSFVAPVARKQHPSEFSDRL